MTEKPLQVDGKQSDYDLQMVGSDAGPTPVLVGIEGQAIGQMHHLAGVRAIQFQDGLVDLMQTSLASTPPEKAFLPITSGTALDTKHSETRDPSAEPDSAAQASVPWGAKQAVASAQYANGHGAAADLLAQPHEDPASTESTAQTQTNQLTEPLPEGELGASPASPSGAGSSPSSATVGLPEGMPRPPSRPDGAPEPGAPSTQQLPSIREIFGTSGPDRLIGSAGPDRIDGMVNFDLVNGSFDELLMGMDGDDLLFYRGFLGEFDADANIRARLFGGDGNDQLTVTLDRVTNVEVDGGPGIDHLILDLMSANADPWSAQFMSWSWNFSGLGPTLMGQYTSPLHPNARITEISPSIDLISTSSGNAMQLVRPASEDDTALIGSSLSDLLIASDATTRVEAGAGNDIVIARSGNTVQLGQGINTLYNADPDITLSYEDSPFGVDVNLSTRLGLVFDADDSIYSIDRLVNAVQNLSGSSHNDRLVGDSQDNIIRTGGGSDVLIGGGGADHFILDLDAQAGASRILDFSIEDGDSVSLNLSALDLSALGLPEQDPYFSFLISDSSGSIVHQGLVNQSAVEEGSILQLQLQDQDSIIYWARPDAELTPLVDLFVDLNQFDEDQWNQFLSVDYL